ncbi:NusG domain II-containing protein [candidate division WOR-3 bacterium]|nr:NusG domain II-containing protein [candidate division WOR-3 bacterium]MCK4527337.1 NusG domain II-containing protein [candidate division WOR-3 bacterium]
MQSKSRYRPIKIGDWIIVLLSLSAIFFIPNYKGEKIRIIVDNEREFIYPLYENRELEIVGRIGTTTIVIENGKVSITDAPCPLKLCMRKGWISKKGEQIICVPNRILIKIEGEYLDAITE